MKFYRVRHTNTEDSDCGKEWFTSRKEAERSKREWEARKHSSFNNFTLLYYVNEHWATVEVVTVQPNKKGILSALNRYASDPANG